MAWFNGAYKWKRQLTLQSSKVSGGSDLTNFAVLISSTIADLKTVGNGGQVQNSSGFDIIFTDSTETTKLDHEIESYTATTGAIVMHVRIPTLSASSNTTIYMYYGNSGISTSQENVTGVWDSNYDGVWHLAAAGGASQPDSTANANTMALAGTPTQTAGQIGGSLSFDGSTQYVGNVPNAGLNYANTDAWTISFWAKPTTSNTGIQCPIAHMQASGNFTGYDILTNASGAGQVEVQLINNVSTNLLSVFTTSATNLNDGSWHLYSISYDGSQTPAGVKIYQDGVSLATSTASNTLSATTAIAATQFAIGSRSNTVFYQGQLDEVRASKAVRTAGWIATGYNSQSSPSTFYTVGNATTIKSVGVRTRLAVRVTKSVGVRLRERVQATKTVGMRFLERVTASRAVGMRLRQTVQRSLAVGMRLIERVTKTVSAPVRARIATQKTVSSGTRVRVRVTNTSNLAVRLRYQTIPFTRSVGMRFIERVTKTVSVPMRVRQAVQSTRTVALRLRERVQQTRTTAVRARLTVQRTLSEAVRTRLAPMNTSSVPLRLLLQGGTIASRYVSVRLRERVTTQTSAPLRFLYRTIFDMLKVKAWDTFYRANQSGWGTASDGVDTWSFAGAAYTSSIVSNEGQLTGTTGIGVGILGANTIADGTAVVGLNASAPATDEIGVILRYTDTSNYYVGKVTNGHLFLTQIVAGTPTNLTSAGITFAATTPYWLRFYVAGTKLKARFWSKDVAEPGTWTIITSSSLTGAHQYGLYYNAASPSNTVLFDNFEVDFSTRAITNPVRLILQAGNTVLAGVRTLLSVGKTVSAPLRTRLRVQQTKLTQLRLRYQTIPFTKSFGTRVLQRVQRAVASPLRARIRQTMTRSVQLRAMVRVLVSAPVGVRARLAALSTKTAPIRTRLAATTTRNVQTRFRLNVARSLSTAVRTRLTARGTVYALVRTRVRVLTTVVAPIRFVYQTITTTRSVGMRLRERITRTAIAPLRARMAQLTTRSTGMRTRVSVLLSDVTGVRTRIAAKNTRVATIRGKVRVLATVSAPMRFVYQTLHTTRSVSVRLVMRGATSAALLRLRMSSATQRVMPLRLRIGLRSTPATGVRLVLFVPPTNIFLRVRKGDIVMRVREP